MRARKAARGVFVAWGLGVPSPAFVCTRSRPADRACFHRRKPRIRRIRTSATPRPAAHGVRQLHGGDGHVDVQRGVWTQLHGELRLPTEPPALPARPDGRAHGAGADAIRANVRGSERKLGQCVRHQWDGCPGMREGQQRGYGLDGSSRCEWQQALVFVRRKAGAPVRSRRTAPMSPGGERGVRSSLRRGVRRPSSDSRRTFSRLRRTLAESASTLSECERARASRPVDARRSPLRHPRAPFAAPNGAGASSRSWNRERKS